MYEIPAQPTKAPTSVFSFDLDSTLADTRHRKGVVEKYKNAGLPVDWTVYAQHCSEDDPTGLVTFLRVHQRTNPWVVVSGRSEGARIGTHDWLERQGLEPAAVYLEDGDTEGHTTLGHTEWKARRVIEVAKIIRVKYNYELVAHFDDWPTVADRIRELSEGKIDGITVTPPGMKAVFPTADNPGEKQEVL